jgi:oligopeptide/dipeptide ABC transporter ATP-binding protein
MTPLVEIVDLVKTYKHPHRRRELVRAVDGVTLHVAEGETVGLVGESGSGKSTIGRCLLGLEAPGGGQLRLDGVDITGGGRRRRRARASMQVVFQDPYSSLNPFLTVGATMREPFVAGGLGNNAAADVRARQLLAQVGLPPDAADRYPRQFSGGQRQRVAIARALMMRPRIVVCDEAVSALDLSTQAQVLNLLAELGTNDGLAYLFIAHDLDVVRHLCDRTVVLYRGRVMEEGPAGEVHDRPLHPYTLALLASAPVLDPDVQARRRKARQELVERARVRDTTAAESGGGCPFATRCPWAEQPCASARPANTQRGNRSVACHAYAPDSGHSACGSGIPAVDVLQG